MARRKAVADRPVSGTSRLVPETGRCVRSTGTSKIEIEHVIFSYQFPVGARAMIGYGNFLLFYLN